MLKGKEQTLDEWMVALLDEHRANILPLMHALAKGYKACFVGHPYTAIHGQVSISLGGYSFVPGEEAFTLHRTEELYSGIHLSILTIVVQTEFARHNPTDLLFTYRHWYPMSEAFTIQRFELLRFGDNLHMSCPEHWPEIERLVQERTESARQHLALMIDSL